MLRTLFWGNFVAAIKSIYNYQMPGKATATQQQKRSRARSSSKQPKPRSSKAKSICEQSSRGGAPFLTDLQSLSIPFALTILSKSISDDKLGQKKQGRPSWVSPTSTSSTRQASALPTETVGGSCKKRSSHPKSREASAASKAKMTEIRKEFASITTAIQQFLNKY
jgi:hypothetical protein